jgi:replicative DNA helicase
MAQENESLNNEIGLLGSALMDAERVMPLAMTQGCRAEWFRDPRCTTMWCALKKLWDESGVKGIDAITLMDAAKRIAAEESDNENKKGEIDCAFVQKMIDDTPTAGHAEFYLQIVKNQYVARKARREAQKFSMDLESGVAQAIQQLSGKLMELLEELTSGGCGDDRAAVIDDVMGEFEKAHRVVMVEGGGKAKYCPGLPMPWEYMTQLYSGARPGMHIISGRPSSGKTALTNNMIRFWCDGLGVAGGLNCLDMSRKAMWARNFSEMSKVSLPKASFGMTSATEMQKLRTAAEKLKTWKLDMRVCRDIEEFRSWVTLGVMRRKWRFCVVDFIQLLNFRECYKMSVDDRTGYISGIVKALGNDLGIPMFALSQLNRECEREGGRAPKASDLRGGGSLEQDASTILMLRREERCEAAWKMCPPKHLTPFGGNNTVQEYLAKRLRPVFAALEKNQDGATGEIPFVFFKNYFTFRLADYLAEPARVDRNGKDPAYTDYTPLFSRVHRDWRNADEDEALLKSGGLVTEYADGEE